MFYDQQKPRFEAPIHPYAGRSMWTPRAEGRYAAGCDFEQAMFDHRSRYLVLILTLGYKKEHQYRKTLNDLRRDRDRLFRNSRTNQLLRNINGYIWAIEEGDASGGLHLHLIIFYDRAYRGDITKGNEIGQYWEEDVTGGDGAFWNSSGDKAENELKWGDATGQINQFDFEKRAALCKVIGYLAKDSQQVSSRDNPHLRMFGTSGRPD